MEIIIEQLFGMLDAALADFTAGWFVLGFLIFAVGLFFIVASVHSRLTGQRVRGKILGAVNQVRFKEKERDGKKVTEKKETPYLIYEYQRQDGTSHQEIGSEGGSLVRKYKTGEMVDLIVCPRPGYDDVYHDNNNTFVFGGILCLVGAVLMSFMLTAHGFNLVFWLSVLGILIPGGAKFFSFLNSSGSKRTSARPPVKQFDPMDIRPVEEIVNTQ